MADLREYCGVGNGEYSAFADLRVNVVEIAKREINSKTDISFEYAQIKDGRKVVAIRFDISRKKVAEAADEIREDPKLCLLVSRLTSHGMSETKARQYVASYPAETIEGAAKELESRLRGKATKDKITNPAGWLCSAIEEGYGSQKTIFEAEEEQRKKQEVAQEAEEAKKQEKSAEATIAYRKYATDYISAFIA